MSRRKPGGGWADFAAVILAIAGFLNAIQGLSALFKKEYFSEAGLLYDNLRVWAFAWLAVGFSQIGTASLLIGRERAGRILGIVFASASAVVSFLSMGAYPVWHLTVLALDVLIIYGLTAHADAFEETLEEPIERWEPRYEPPAMMPPVNF